MVYDKSKWLATMIAKYGSEEAVREEMRRRKRKQGQTSFTGGFASNIKGRDGLTGPERASLYGGKRNVQENNEVREGTDRQHA